MRHKNDEWIRAWLDGKPVQYRHVGKNYSQRFQPVNSLDVFDWNTVEFIVKEPEDTECLCEAYIKGDGSAVLSKDATHPNLSLKFDGYGKLIEAKLLPETIYD